MRGRSGEHALQLGTPHAVHQGAPLRLHLFDQALVALRLAELEQLQRVGQLRAQAADRTQRLLQRGALAQQPLSLDLVVPEVRSGRQLIELF
jgi:hypothetical protein